MPDLEDQKICSKCQMPLEKKGSGSLTQWIKVCNCGRVDASKVAAAPVNICVSCGKRIEGGRAGTLTQWIFRADLCACDAPVWASERASAPETRENTEVVADETGEMTLEPGTFPLDRYAPLRQIGMGASGTVYLCRDRLLKKKVAVKVLNNTSSEQLVAFQSEARSTSQLEHVNIVKVFDFGVTDGKNPFMVLEYIDGMSLAELLAEKQILELEDALIILEQICDALSFAHSRKLFHRDLKPTNIIVTRNSAGQLGARLIDFGVGVFKQHETNSHGRAVVGSPAYMSPDQAQGRAFDARSEVYSLGCVLFEVLTGRPPFRGKTALETISKHAHEKPPWLSEANDTVLYSDSIEKIVATCLKKSPQERYQSVGDLKQALLNLSSETPVEERLLIDEPPPVAKSSRQSIVAFSLIALFVCTAIGIIVFKSGLLESSPNPPQSSKVEAPPTLNEAMNSIETNAWYPGSDGFGHSCMTSSGPVSFDKNFAQLNDVPDLEYVSIAVTDNVTGVGFNDIVGKKLKGIIIKSTGLTDEGVRAIVRFKTLISLRISMASKLTLAAYKDIATLPNLQLLDIGMAKIPTGAFSEIVKLKKLFSFSLYNCVNLTAPDIASLASLPNLKYLDLSGTHLGEEIIETVIKLKSLAQLRMGNLDLTDKYLSRFAEMPNLENLWISQNPKITDAGFLQLAKIKSLRILVLDNCPGITSAGRSQFKKLRPDVKLSMVIDEGTRIIRSLDSLE